MSETPIPPELGARFLRGEATRAEGVVVLRRLLLDPSYAAELASQTPAAGEAELEKAFAGVLARVPEAEAGAEAERSAADRQADEVVAKLEAGARAEAEDAIRRDGELRTSALSEALCRRSFETGLEDPERGVDLARLSVTAAELATAGSPVSRLDRDLLGAAWAQRGNAHRIASDLREAEAAFETARAHLEAGTGDPLVRAQLLSFEASLARDRARFQEGISRCRKGARLYRRVGDSHGQARMLIQEADLHANAEDMPRAVQCLDLAAARVDAAREPRLELVVQHNLVSFLDRQGRYDEAWDRLGKAREIARRLGHRLDLIRLRWLEGRVAAHRGRADHAEMCWNEARAAFVDLGIAYDAALVSLEIVGLLEGQGRRAEILELVEEMVPIFRSRSLHREAQTALKVFHDAVVGETAEIVELAREVGDYLEQARNRPEIPFRAERRR